MGDSQPFENTDEFLQVFDSLVQTDYVNLTHLVDHKVGFSVTRNYPKDLLFRPARTNKDQPDSVALMHVVYAHPAETGRPFVSNRIPVSLSATVHSLYLGKGHRGYNYEDPDSPTRETVESSKKSTRPFGLDSFDEYYFSHETSLFYDRKENRFTGVQLLDSLFEKHCNTARRVKGLTIRTQVRWLGLIATAFGILVHLLTWCLETLFGRTLKRDETPSAFLKGYPSNALIMLSDETLNLFGYKAPKRAVITFATIVTLVGLLYVFLARGQSPSLDGLFSNPLFSVSTGVFLLWFVSSVLPRFLFALLNSCIKLRTKLWFWWPTV